ncbi:MFS transporter [Dictyobacter vulcani]|uniref:MFS transporter n=1 Tax=Dictyobacter vulcani TaxID=2607529 RepID=A0A5J4KMN4_9CHLR|nr:MFS transporter [Dictyobacter vulcani]GER87379.1 MFS transporter [Dictyobacter vulcani]
MDQKTLMVPEAQVSGSRPARFFFRRYPQFALFWTGQTFSNFGSHISAAGLPIVALELLQASSLQLGLLVACNSLPVLLLSLLAGVWIDRWPRRPIMILSDFGRGLLLGAIPLAALLGGLRIELLYLVTFLISILTIFFEVAQRSWLPALLQEQDLIEGNSQLGVSEALAEIAGPPSAAWLIQLLHAPLAILLDAGTFLLSAVSIWCIHAPEGLLEPAEAPQRFWQDLLEGVQLLWRQPYLRAMAAYSGLFNFFGGSFATLYMLYLISNLHLPLIAYGLMVAMGGIGNLLGAMLASRVARRYGGGRTMIACALLFGVTALGTPLAAGPVWWLLVVLALTQLLGDCALTIYMVNEMSWRQTQVPEKFQGRINACMHLIQNGIGPLGAIVAGLCSQAINDVRLTLLYGSIGMLLAAAPLLISPLRKRQTT